MEKINLTQSGRGYLFRASASEICNYDCAFCHPARNESVTRLSDEEFLQVFRVANELYVLKTLHFTGGEPLMRASLPEIIRQCRLLTGSELDIAMTTNASLLGHQLPALVEAGISRTNISLHSLNPHKYKQFTGSNVEISTVLYNMEQVRQAGLGVKVNSVVIRGFNDMDVVKTADYCFRQGIVPRFLELGIYGPVSQWFSVKDQVPHQEILQKMQNAFGPFERDFTYWGNGPSKYYKNSSGNVFGILDNQSDTLCRGCDRFRMSANGYIKVCNFPPIDLRPCLHDEAALKDALLTLGNELNSRGQNYIGIRLHRNDYNFRWNHPEKNVWQEKEEKL